MGYDLGGVERKLARADESLAILYGQRSMYLRDHGNRFLTQLDSQDELVCSLREAPPQEMGTEVGVFLHFCRSALDNLLCCVVDRHTGRVGTRHQFPIYEKEADFCRKPKGGGLPKGEWQTKGVSDDEFTFIKDSQPFNARPGLAKWEPLALLGYLNNIDKHRHIHVAAAGAAVRVYVGPFANRPFLIVGADAVQRSGFLGRGEPTTGFLTNLYVNGEHRSNGYRFVGSDHPTEIVRFIGVGVMPDDAEVNMDPRPSIEVSFSDGKRPVTVHDLIDIRATVVEIVNWFRPRIT